MTRFRHQLFRSWPGLFAIALTTSSMVGCGGGDEPAEEPASTEASRPAATEPAAPPAKAKNNEEEASARPANKPTRQVALPGGMSAPPATNPNAAPKQGGSTGRQIALPGGMAPPAGMNLGGGGTGESSSVAASSPAEPPRSKDFAAWSAEDFKNAVRERDKTILGAIAWLAENKQDNASAALLLELLAIANEPAKQPPAGARPGGGGRRSGMPQAPGGRGQQPNTPKAPQSPGGNGAAVGFLDNAELFDVVALALNGRLASLATTSILLAQNGPPAGYGQNGPPAGYGNGQQGGPPPGYGQGQSSGGPPPGYGTGQSSGGPPPGYGNGQNSGGPPPGYGNGQGMSGPPPGYGGGPPGSSSPPRQGGNNAGGNGLGRGGRNSGGRSSASSGDYSHYGTLDMDAFVKGVVVSLRKIDSPKAWDGIAGLLNGTLTTPIGTDETSKLVLAGLLENYGGPGHPTHMLLMELVTSDSPQSEMALEVFTDYAGTAIDQLLGLVEPQEDQAVAANTNPAAAAKSNRQLSMPGGMPAGGMAGVGGAAGVGGGSNGRSPVGPGGRSPVGPGGRSPAGGGQFGNGGGDAAPARNTVSLTMASSQRVISKEHFGNVTGFLWGSDFNQAIADRLSQTNLADSGQLIALASSLPTSASRKAQFSSFSANQKQRADSYSNAGLFSQIARDPGLLVSLKSMTQSKRGPGTVQTGWDEAVKASALALRDRLRVAAETSGGLTMPVSSIKLPKGSEPDAVYHVKWPRDVEAELGSGKPAYTEILYVRTTASGNEAQLKKLVRHYQKISKANSKINERDEGRQILWYSGLRKLPTGLKRSVDVVFSQDRGRRGGNNQAGGGRSLTGPGGAAGGRSQNAIIEVIMVETPDPNPPTQSASLSK